MEKCSRNAALNLRVEGHFTGGPDSLVKKLSSYSKYAGYQKVIRTERLYIRLLYLYQKI